MSFSGKIEEFSLAEIIQVIGYSKRSGRLEINGNIVNLSIVFREGNAVGVIPEYNSISLGHLLITGGYIDPAGLNTALTVQEDEAKSGSRKQLGSILLELGMVERGILDKYLSAQVKDSIYDILSEREGTFEFVALENPPEAGSISPVDISDLILHGMREIETRAKIKELVTSADVVLKKNARVEVTDIGRLVGEERMVYFAVDGIKPIGDILDQPQLKGLNVPEALYRLIKKSYIKVPGAYLYENST